MVDLQGELPNSTIGFVSKAHRAGVPIHTPHSAIRNPQSEIRNPKSKVELVRGLEPLTCRLQGGCSTFELHQLRHGPLGPRRTKGNPANGRPHFNRRSICTDGAGDLKGKAAAGPPPPSLPIGVAPIAPPAAKRQCRSSGGQGGGRRPASSRCRKTGRAPDRPRCCSRG